ncbi:MAG: Uma2 family endonuclease [Gloeomargarita sp. SKYG116]|nr:Uma2 family endonuclease [Gloeomargarita sp. SKYG116]MDW8400632.1 hypothetical protein [Gloeomargarita sp. SKYGB_i_bin116]
MKLHSAHGVSEYRLVDWFNRQVEMYRRMKGWLERVVTPYANNPLTSPLLPGFDGRLGEIFA